MIPKRLGRAWPWLVFGTLIVALGALLRLLHLEGDPAYGLWAGYVTDEGRWTEQARLFALNHSLRVEGWASLHLLLAPLFQLMVSGAFLGGEVGVSSARLVSALSAILTLGAIFFLFRRFSGEALVLTLVLLVFQPDLLTFNRLAIPESSALFVAFAAFILITWHPISARRLFAGGLLTVAAVGFKLTTAPLVPIFFAIALAMHSGNEGPKRWARAAAFLGGVVAPAILLGGLIVAIRGTASIGWVASGLRDLTYFLRVESPYEAIAGIVYSDLLASAAPLFVAACLVGAGVFALGPRPAGIRINLYRGSLLWVVGWLAASALLDYFPDRYFIHLILPLAVNVGAGFAILQEAGIAQLDEALDRLRGLRRALLAALLVLPVAILTAPILLAAGDVAGIGVDRLRHHAFLVIAADLLLTWSLLRWWQARNAWRLVSLTLLLVTFHQLLALTGAIGPDFWRPDLSGAVAGGLALLGAAFVVLVSRGGSERTVFAVAAVFVASTVVVWAFRSVPEIVAPTYTLRDAARTVEAVAGPDQTVGTNDSGGILLGTRLRYSEHLQEGLPPDILVVVFNRLPPGYLDQYELVARQKLNLGSDYVPSSQADMEMKVYKLRGLTGQSGTSAHPAAEPQVGQESS